MARAHGFLFITLFCVLFLAVGRGLAADRPSSMPSYIASRFGPNNDPVWVSAASLVDPQGRLIQNSLPRLTKIAFDQELASGDYQKRGCVTFMGMSEDLAGPVRPHASLRDLAKNSLAILRGSVTDIDRGFSRGIPALMLEISLSEEIKGSSTPSQFYIPYPKANFEIGGYRFCSTDPRWPEPPQVGDEILFFPYRGPSDDGGRTLVPDPEGYELFFATKGNSLVAPRGVKEAEDLIGVKDLETLRRSTLRVLRSSEPAKPQEK